MLMNSTEGKLTIEVFCDRIPETWRNFRTESNYSILGVTPLASPQEIKRAYLARVQEYHPDKLPLGVGKEIRDYANNITKWVNLAYEQLRKYNRSW